MWLKGNPFLKNYLSFGQFHFFNTGTWSKTERIILNRLIKLVILINALKLIVIVLAAWFGFLDIKFYLIEMFDENHQKWIDVGVSIVQVGLLSGFSYWTSLDKKIGLLESFSFLLITETNDLRQHYHLDKQSADKFIKRYHLSCLLLKSILTLYSIFFLGVITRCYYHCLHIASLTYFLSIGLLFWMITLTGYLFLELFIMSNFILVLLSTEFLVLRIKAINTVVCDNFSKTDLADFSRAVKLRRQKANTLKVLRILNDFCQQFREINSVLDPVFSVVLIGVYFNMFILPYFLLFVNIELGIRLFSCLLAVVVYLLCFSFSLCNDRLRGQVSQSVDI